MSWHLNPYEKMDREKFLFILLRIVKTIEEYEQNAAFAKYIVPERVHEKIIALAGKIKNAKDFYAYYHDAKELYTVLDLLNKQDVFENPQKAARAYGRLLMVVGSIAMKNSNPIVKQYGQLINTLGAKFERLESLLNGTHGDEQYRNFDPHVMTN